MIRYHLPWLFTSLLASTAVAQTGVVLPKKAVTLHYPAANLQSIVKAVGKATGVKLTTALGKEIVFLHVVDSPLSEVMERLAAAVNAEWHLVDGTYRLERSPEVEKREAAAESLDEVAKLKMSLAKFLAENSPKPPVVKVGLGYSFQRVIPKLLNRVNVEELASIRERERVVFSTDPNSMQRPLGVTMSQVLDLIAADLNLYKSAGTLDTQPENIAATLERLPANVQKASQGSRTQEALLVVFRTGRSLFLDLRIYNSSGQLAFPATARLDVDAQPSASQEVPSSLKETDAKLVVGPEAKAITRWFAMGTGSAPIPKKVLEKLRRPDVYDPYSFEVSDCLSSVATSKRANLVASIPDSIDPVHGIFGNDLPSTVNQYLSTLSVKHRLTLVHENRWITIKPAAPNAARSKRVDRSSLTKLLLACQGNQAKLHDLGDYAADNPNSAFIGVADPYYLMFCPNLLSMGERTIDWDALCFYGALSPSDQRSFVDGATFRYGAMSPALRQQATQIVFWGQPSIELTEEEGQTPLSWLNEPTELLPNGLPPTGVLRINTKDDFALAYSADSTAAQYGSMSAKTYGTMAFREEGSGTNWRETKLRLGSRKSYLCEFLLAENAKITKVLTEDSFADSNGLKNWVELPEVLRAAIDKQVTAERKRIEEVRNRSRNNPPPNR